MVPRYFIRLAKRGTAVFMSLCLLWSSCNLAQAVNEIPQMLAKPLALPQLDLAPPGHLGRLADYFNAPGQNSKLVILIQDLHANYGVQKNIAGILEFSAKKLSSDHQKTVPFAVTVEGAEGPVDTSKIALFPEQKLKQEALDYLMREAELTGMEYFAAMRGIPHLLIGVEDGRFYNAHRELFRKTLESRTQLVEMLRGIQSDINLLRSTTYSQAVAAVQEKIDTYDKAELSTVEFINYLVGQADKRELDVSPALKAFIQNSATDANRSERLRQLTRQFLTQVADHLSPEERATLAALAKKQGLDIYYGYLRDLIYKHQLFMAVPMELAKYLEYRHTAQSLGFDQVTHEADELAFRVKMRATPGRQEKDLIQVEHDLALLLKVANLQATEYEVTAFGPRLNEFVALCHSLLASHGLKTFDEARIRELISASIDYYVMALMRNRPMVENTLRLLGAQSSGLGRLSPQPPAQSVAVLVTGGFHTSTLAQLLREKNVSYLVLTPTVEELTDKEHELYIKRLAGNHLTKEEVVRAAQGQKFLFQGYLPAVRDYLFETFIQARLTPTSSKPSKTILHRQVMRALTAFESVLSFAHRKPVAQPAQAPTPPRPFNIWGRALWGIGLGLLDGWLSTLARAPGASLALQDLAAILGLAVIAIAVSVAAAALARRLSPKDLSMDSDIQRTIESWANDLHARVQWPKPRDQWDAQDRDWDRRVGRGWLEGFYASPDGGMTFRFAPWLVAYSDNRIFRRIRGHLLPIVWAHVRIRLWLQRHHVTISGVQTLLLLLGTPILMFFGLEAVESSFRNGRRDFEISPPDDTALAMESDLQTRGIRHIGPYPIVKELGHGGMGVTYLAKDPREPDRLFVIKIGKLMNSEGDEIPLEVLFNEAFVLHQIAAESAESDKTYYPQFIQLTRNNNGTPYLVMEYMPGVTLDKFPVSNSEQALRIVARVLKALQPLHRAGIVHRDLKPSNIMIDEQDETRVRIFDFGLAMDARLTGRMPVQAPTGTMLYNSPEQAKGLQWPTASSDLFSLGLILYEKLTGKRAKNMDLHWSPRKFHAELDRDSTIRPEIKEIIKRATQQDTERRYQTAAEMESDLESFLSAGGPAAPPATRAADVNPETIVNIATKVAQKAAEALEGKTNPEIEALIEKDLLHKGIEWREGNPLTARRGSDVLGGITSLRDLEVHYQKGHTSQAVHEWLHVLQVEEMLKAGLPPNLMENPKYLRLFELPAHEIALPVALRQIDIFGIIDNALGWLIYRVGLGPAMMWVAHKITLAVTYLKNAVGLLPVVFLVLMSSLGIWKIQQFVEGFANHQTSSYQHLRQALIMSSGSNFSPADTKLLFKFFGEVPPSKWGQLLERRTATPYDDPSAGQALQKDIIDALSRTASKQEDKNVVRQSLVALAAMLDDVNEPTRVQAAEALDNVAADLSLLGDRQHSVEQKAADILQARDAQLAPRNRPTNSDITSSSKFISSIEDVLSQFSYIAANDRQGLAADISQSIPRAKGASELHRLSDLAKNLRTRYRIHNEGNADLREAIASHNANCIGSTQLLAAAVSAIGLHVQPIEVINNFTYHVMSLIRLADGRYVFVDLLQPNRSIGIPFDLQSAYAQEGAFWRAHSDVPEGAPRQFRMLDAHGIAAYVTMEEPYVSSSLLVQRRDYEAASTLDSSNPWAWVHLGETHLRIEHQHGQTSRANYSQAATAFRRALEIAPDFLPALELAWVVDHNEGNLDAAAQKQNHLITLLEAQIPTDLLRAGTVYEGGDPRAGQERAVLAGLYQERAILFDELGQHEQAVSDRQKRNNLAGRGSETSRFDNLVDRPKTASITVNSQRLVKTNAHSAEENANELLQEGHWWDALSLVLGAVFWFVHVKVFRQEPRAIIPRLIVAMHAALGREDVIIKPMDRKNGPGRGLAGARVSIDKETGIETVFVNTYAPFKANVRGSIHETEHLKNPDEIGKPEEETRIIRKSYEMMNRLEAMVKEHQAKALEGVQSGAQIERHMPHPQIEDVKDPILTSLLPVWHLHKEQGLVSRVRRSLLLPGNQAMQTAA